MNTPTLKRAALAGFALSLMMLGACATPVAPLCEAPSSRLVSTAFATARSTLSRSECSGNFRSYFDSLLTISKGDPGPANLNEFQDLMQFAFDNGIVSRKDGQELYSSYFSRNFVSLPDDRSNCSAVGSVDRLEREMRMELDKKRIGLVDVAGSPDKYAGAQRDYQSVLLIMRTLNSACDA